MGALRHPDPWRAEVWSQIPRWTQDHNFKMRTLLRACLPLFLIASFLSLSLSTANAQWEPMNPVTAVHQEKDGVVFSLQTGTLKIQVCSDSVLRILYSGTSNFPEREDYVVTKKTWAGAPFTV